MLALNDVDARLHGVFVQSVDEEAADDLSLVIKFAQEALLAITSHTRNGRIGACILPAQVIAHFSPHGTQLLND